MDPYFVFQATLSVGIIVIGHFTKTYHSYLKKGNPIVDPYDLGELGVYEFFLYSNGISLSVTVLGLMFVFTGLQFKKDVALAVSNYSFIPNRDR